MNQSVYLDRRRRSRLALELLQKIFNLSSRDKLPEGWTPMTSHLQPRNGSPGPASGDTKIHIQAEAKIPYSSSCSSKQTSKRQED